MNEKILKNALISEKLYQLSKEERKEVVTELLKNNTERGLAKELGIPQSTIHDWKTLRQNNVGVSIHVSLNGFYRKISNSSVDDIKDWGRLKMIKERIDQLLRQKGI